MDLRILIDDDRGADHEVMVEADSAHTVGDVGAALCRHLGLDVEEATLLVTATGQVLDVSTALGSSDLRSGDRLRVVPTGSAVEGDGSPEPPFHLVAIGGPAIGTVHNLAPGLHVVGRARSSVLGLGDPYVSQEHLHLRVTSDGAVISDAGSSNGTVLDGEQLGSETRSLECGKMIEAGASLLELRRPPARRIVRPPARRGLIPFNRPPRVAPNRPVRTWTIQAPPEALPKNRLPLTASIFPLILAAGMWFITGNATYLALAVFTPLMAVGSYVEDRRTGRRERRRKLEEFNERLRETVEDATVALDEEAEDRRAAAPDAEDLLDRVTVGRPDLWDRRPEDPDWLVLRAGWGDADSGFRLELAAGGDDDLRGHAEEQLAGFGSVHAVPLSVPLGQSGVVGLAGPDNIVDALGRWLAGQIAALHSPGDVAIAVAVHPDRAPGWAWTTWLPHTTSETSPLAPTWHVATDAVAANELLQGLLSLVRRRLRSRGDRQDAGTERPEVVVVLDGRLPLGRDDVAELLTDGPRVGVRTVWLGVDVPDLPGGCRTVVEVDGETGTFEIIDTVTGERQQGHGVDGLSVELASHLGLGLTSVRDVSVRGAAGAVPRVAPLLELLNLEAVAAETIGERWKRPSRGLDVVIGAGSTGPVSIDLRADGPHGLVGGTTGAGKSELLQSLVAALAATHPPTRLNFLLVDYKGGAAFKDCVDLPHTVGFVTDLDGALVHRALVSLNAELRRREHLLRDADAKDLIELERLSPDFAPANLLIVVDEFATLVKELPEFVDGIVDVAQRGRSLGVHLLLATQRPSGAINDSIRANTNLRVALRMNDVADSEDVIGASDAAHVPRSVPGRAFLRTGPSELVEFQSAYVGGVTEGDEHAAEIVVRDLADGIPVKIAAGVTTLRRPVEESATDLERLVVAVCEARDSAGIAEQPAPWLPALPDVLPLDDLPDDPTLRGVARVGLLDIPEEQAQRPWSLDLERDGGLLVYGAAGSGKTTLLRTIAADLAKRHSPDELHLYGLDFGTHGLGALEALPHCGSVVTGVELERVNRLFTMLSRWIDERKRKLGASGSGTLEAHCAATEEMLPRIVVLIDSYAGLVASFERVDHAILLDMVPRIISEGRSVGVHLIVTAQRRADVPQQVAGLIPRRVIMSLADPDDYLVLGVDPKLVRGLELPSGRGMVDGRFQLQTAVVGYDASASSQNTAIRTLASELPEPSMPPPPASLLPVDVDSGALPLPSHPLHAYVGLEENDLAAIPVDLTDGHFLVIGPTRSGRTTTLGTVATSLASGQRPPRLILLAPRRTKLTGLGIFEEVIEGVESCEDFIQELGSLLDGDSRPLVLVIDDVDELVNGAADMTLESIARQARRDGNHRILAALESSSAHRAFGGLSSELRKDRFGILLMPDIDMDGDLLGTRLVRRSTVSFPAGRGYLVNRGETRLIQVATWNADEDR